MLSGLVWRLSKQTLSMKLCVDLQHQTNMTRNVNEPCRGAGHRRKPLLCPLAHKCWQGTRCCCPGHKPTTNSKAHRALKQRTLHKSNFNFTFHNRNVVLDCANEGLANTKPMKLPAGLETSQQECKPFEQLVLSRAG